MRIASCSVGIETRGICKSVPFEESETVKAFDFEWDIHCETYVCSCSHTHTPTPTHIHTSISNRTMEWNQPQWMTVLWAINWLRWAMWLGEIRQQHSRRRNQWICTVFSKWHRHRHRHICKIKRSFTQSSENNEIRNGKKLLGELSLAGRLRGEIDGIANLVGKWIELIAFVRSFDEASSVGSVSTLAKYALFDVGISWIFATKSRLKISKNWKNLGKSYRRYVSAWCCCHSGLLCAEFLKCHWCCSQWFFVRHCYYLDSIEFAMGVAVAAAAAAVEH